MKQFKTFFIIIAISLIAITVNATIIDTTSTSTVVKTDSTSLTFARVYNDIKGGILGLAEALKTPAEHVYKILVKQQVINAWSGLIFIIVMLILLFLSIRYLKDCNNNEDIKDLTGPILLVIIALIVTFGVFIVVGPDILTGFFNPEYGAIKDIVNFIK